MKNTKLFQFLPNGKTLSSLKSDAKKLHKSGKAKSHTIALNTLSKEITGKAFNKSSNEIDISSPRISSNTLYIPIKIDLSNYDEEEGYFYYYVALNNTEIALSSEYSIDISDLGLDLTKLQLQNFSKILPTINKSENGWHINFKDFFITIKTTDEGLMCDVYVVENEEEECVESSYVFFDELFEPQLQSSIINNKILSDYKASYLLGHNDDRNTTSLISIGGINVFLYSVFIIDTKDEDNARMSPEQVLHKIKDEQLSEKDFWLWLEGKEHSDFKNWEITSTPYFGLEKDGGEAVGEIFDELPKTLSERALMISENFISE